VKDQNELELKIRELVRRGFRYRRQGDLASSTAAFREVLSFDPMHVQARCEIARNLLFSYPAGTPGAVEASLEPLQPIIRDRPDIDALVLAADICAKHGANVQARRYLGHALREHRPGARRQNRKRAMIIMRLGFLYLQSGRAGRAERCFSNAMSLVPGLKEAVLGLAAAREAQGRWEEGLSVLQAAIRHDPTFTEGMAEAGRLVYLYKQDNRVAGRFFRQALMAQPHNAAAMYGLGRLAEDSGDDDTAISMWRAVLRLDPEFGPAALSLAQLYFRRQDNDNALKSARKAARLMPGDAAAWVVLGAVEFARNQVSAAARAWNTAATLDPADPITRVFLGQARFMSGDHHGAVAAWEQALLASSQRDMPPDMTEQVSFLLGTTYELVNRPAEVIEKAGRMLRHHPDNLWMLLTQARAWLNLGDIAMAERATRRAIAIDPGEAMSYALLARVHAARGRMRQAVASVTRALGIDPEDPYLLETRGDIFAAQGQWKRAKEAWMRAAGQAPYGQVMSSIALALCLLGKPDEGRAMLEEHLQKRPGDSAAVLRLAQVYLSLGEIEESRHAWLLGKALEARHPALIFMDGVYRAMNNDDDAAVRKWRQAWGRATDVLWAYAPAIDALPAVTRQRLMSRLRRGRFTPGFKKDIMAVLERGGEAAAVLYQRGLTATLRIGGFGEAQQE